MNDMRKLIEAVEQLDDGVSQDRRDEHSAEAREYAAFVYGVEWGNSAQYSDGGYDSEELPSAYKDWVDGGRKGLYEDKNEFVARLDNSFEEKIKAAYTTGYDSGYGAGNFDETYEPEKSYEVWRAKREF